MKTLSYVLLTLSICTSSSFGSVLVTAPTNGQTANSPVPFIATGTTSTCARGVASMGVYVDNVLKYVVIGNSLNTSLPLNPGTYNTVIEEWDFCGGATYTPVPINVTNQGGVFVTSPATHSTVSPHVNFVATATTSSCGRGVASMGVYVNDRLTYVSNGASLNTQLTLGSGPQHTVVEEWDYCGGASYTPVDLVVVGNGTVLSNLQASGGWRGWGELPPVYDICNAPCSNLDWSMAQHVSSPSLSGNATRFDMRGSVPYSDILWSNPVIGQNSTQNLADSSQTLLPGVHNFTYDADVFVTDASVTQVLEFDINMYMNGAGMIWGTQCNHLSDGDWDIWDNQNGRWVSTGAPCHLLSGAWNHVTIQAQREADNTLLYQSITMNGTTVNINRTYAPFSVPAGWWGITVNYQMDGNYKQSPNTTYLDNFSLTYW